MNIKTLPWGKILPVGLTAGLLGAVALTAAVSADAAPAATPPAPGSITGSMVKDGTLYGADMNPAVVKWFTGTWNNTVVSDSVKDGALQEKDFSDAVKTKLNQIGTGAQGPKGDTGATGPAGKDGKDAIVSVTAMSSLTNRPDSGGHGDWATDTLTRNVSITRASAVDADKCGAAATVCWLYTGSIADNGTFTTITGAMSPNAGDLIAGTVNGTVTGAAKIQFYASSDAPNPALVDATVDGSAHPTGEWAKMFFPAGTVVTVADMRDWGWTYDAATICNKWVNAKAGNTGDITGVNAC